VDSLGVYLFVALLAERTGAQQLDQVVAVEHLFLKQSLGDLFEALAVLTTGVNTTD
jgi:hypothetical protein